jgi:hypothetical protein
MTPVAPEITAEWRTFEHAVAVPTSRRCEASAAVPATVEGRIALPAALYDSLGA